MLGEGTQEIVITLHSGQGLSLGGTDTEILLAGGAAKDDTVNNSIIYFIDSSPMVSG